MEKQIQQMQAHTQQPAKREQIQPVILVEESGKFYWKFDQPIYDTKVIDYQEGGELCWA